MLLFFSVVFFTTFVMNSSTTYIFDICKGIHFPDARYFFMKYIKICFIRCQFLAFPPNLNDICDIK